MGRLDPMDDSGSLDNYSAFLRGFEYLKKSRIDEARSTFEEMLRTQPDDAYGIFGMGCVYALSGLTNKAVKEWLKAVEIDPYLGEAHYTLAWASYRSNPIEATNKHLILAWESNTPYETVKDLIERFPEPREPLTIVFE